VEDHEKIKELFARYLADQCSGEEVRILLQYFNADENKALLQSLIRDELEASPGAGNGQSMEAPGGLDSIYQDIKSKLKKQNK
jgi:hypothetical protein